jgi:protein phosphatase
MQGKTPFVWTSESHTHVGKVRTVNEDAALQRPDIGLWIVADGMGGHAAGDVASHLLVDSLRTMGMPESLSAFVDEVEDRILRCNAELRTIGAKRRHRTVGTTVAALLAYTRFALALWAGDSRIYLYRGGNLVRLTQDHALVEDLLDKGMLTAEQAKHHPHANLITRAVGASDHLYLDLEICALHDGDTFLLCSDGLTREVPDEAIAKALATSTEGTLSENLINLALEQGAHDNTTVITVHVRATAGHEEVDATPEATRAGNAAE